MPFKRACVIAIGSNSTRLLVADLGCTLSNRVRGRHETRLFLSLGEDMGIGAAALDSVREAVLALYRQAIAAGAEEAHLVATAAVRGAPGADSLREALQKDTGLALRVISGEEEARLSFLGAACAYPAGTRLGVADIGGGSTEVAAGTLEGIEYSRSAGMGASRLYRRRPIDAPGDMEQAINIAHEALGELPPLPVKPDKWLLVGGTGAALIGLLRGKMMNPDAGVDEPFTREQALRTLRQLADLRTERRAALPGMTPGREGILPTGLAVLAAMTERFHIEDMAVTARNNTDGFLYSLPRPL